MTRGNEAYVRGHVTSETGVAEVAVFGAFQPNAKHNDQPSLPKYPLNMLKETTN